MVEVDEVIGVGMDGTVLKHDALGDSHQGHLLLLVYIGHLERSLISSMAS